MAGIDIGGTMHWLQQAHAQSSVAMNPNGGDMKIPVMKWSMIVAVLVGLALPSLARAHGAVPFGAPSVIHACRSALGILRQVTTVTCAQGEAIVHWSVTGSTRADGPCFSNGGRYVDCGNGTVTDTLTGLIWLKQTDCLGIKDWAAAGSAAADLKAGDCGLTDGSWPSDWRLPTRSEWDAMIAPTALACSAFVPGGTPPTLANDPGTACLSVGPTSFLGVRSDYYWTATTAVEFSYLYAYFASLVSGTSNQAMIKGPVVRLGVWPVRGGAR
jgi:hypothetical protein